MNKKRVVLFVALAYLWTLIDDNPVNADMLLGARGYFAMEAVLHLLTAAFFYLAIREASLPEWGGAPLEGTGRVLGLALLPLLAVWLDDIIAPLGGILQPLRGGLWYPLDMVEHAASLLFLYLAIRAAERHFTNPAGKALENTSRRYVKHISKT